MMVTPQQPTKDTRSKMEPPQLQHQLPLAHLLLLPPPPLGKVAAGSHSAATVPASTCALAHAAVDTRGAAPSCYGAAVPAADAAPSVDALLVVIATAALAPAEHKQHRERAAC